MTDDFYPKGSQAGGASITQYRPQMTKMIICFYNLASSEMPSYVIVVYFLVYSLDKLVHAQHKQWKDAFAFVQ
jgi:hypothetical protein